MKLAKEQILAEHYNLDHVNQTTGGVLGMSLAMGEIQNRNSLQNPLGSGLKIMVNNPGQTTASWGFYQTLWNQCSPPLMKVEYLSTSSQEK